jgi:plasmid stabilization system protein ParE
MSRTLRIAGRAADDVDAIFNWLLRRSARGAIAWYLAFRHAARDVASDPEIHGLAPEGERLQRLLRQTLFKMRRGRTYRIVFAVEPSEVVILRLRDPGQAPLRAPDLRAAPPP